MAAMAAAGSLAPEGPGQGQADIGAGGNTAGRGHHVEGRQGVAGRASALSQDVVDGVVADVEAGVADDPADVVGQFVGREEVEVEPLGPAADRGDDLVGLGGGQHEHDVVWRLLEGLQQGVLGSRAEHVDLVEDVDLGPGRGSRG